MELIYYEEAAKLLGTSRDVVKQAAVRGDLTRVGAEWGRQRIIKEQVLLFSGVNPRSGKKKQISYKRLTPAEQALWRKYANEAQNTPVSTTIDEIEIARMIEQHTQQLERKIREELFGKLSTLFQEMSRPKTWAAV